LYLAECVGIEFLSNNNSTTIYFSTRKLNHNTKCIQNLIDKYRLSSTFALHGYKTELLHQAQSIIPHPRFHELAASNANNADLSNRHHLTGRRDAHKFTLVYATECKAYRHSVPFDDRVIKGDMNVGKSSIELAHRSLVALDATCVLAGATVFDVVSGEQLVYCGNDRRLSLVRLLKKTTHERPEIFC